MENLEFRAWDLKSQSMHRVKTLDLSTSSVICAGLKITDCDIVLGFNEFKLMRSTAYTDKNKTLLFKGDIVKDRFDRVMQITFHNGRLLWQCDDPKNNFKYADLFQWISKGRGMAKNETILSVERIGNIYENPELLNT